MKQVKCAFFDFDNTIAKGDTIYKLLPYTLKRHPLAIFRFVKLGFSSLYNMDSVPNEVTSIVIQAGGNMSAYILLKRKICSSSDLSNSD